jgi:hypothetical protein
VFYDLLVDHATGQLVAASDTPGYHIRSSDDLGLSFGPEQQPPGQHFYSDWALGNGSIFVVGTSGSDESVTVIPAAAPFTSSEVFGLATIGGFERRAIAADVQGNAYVVSQMNDNSVQVDFLPSGAPSVQLGGSLGPGLSPGVAALPTADGALVVFHDGPNVYVAVVKQAARSCLEIQQQGGSHGSGIYVIDPDGAGGASPFPVFCDMVADGGGWTMVHKLVRDVPGDVMAIWRGPPANEVDTSLLDPGTGVAHYHNRIPAMFWNQNGVIVNEARVAVYGEGSVQAFMHFNASGSTRDSWFDFSRLVGSSWGDIGSGFNFFSMDGDAGIGRRWFVNRNYGGCNLDTGWLVVSDVSGPCSWEQAHEPTISILYAPPGGATLWDSAGVEADAFVVFVR